MIDSISKTLSQPFTKKQLINAIKEKYGKMRRINVDSLGTDIAGCCVNLKSHRSLPDLPLILVSLGRGTYRRYNPKTDKQLNRYQSRTKKIVRTHESVRLTPQPVRNQSSLKVLLYNHYDAEQILKNKGLLNEVHQIVKDINSVDHKHIQNLFSQKGWDLEHEIHPKVRWAWDAYKDKIPVSIELSLIDAVHRDLLRLILWKHENKVDAVVYITSTFKEPKFENVKRDLEIFRPIFDLPVLLIGLGN